MRLPKYTTVLECPNGERQQMTMYTCESSHMATYDINPTKCDISPISDTSTTEQACTIGQDMSVDKQIPVEVPMSADSHPIDGQNSDTDTDLSLPIDQYYESNPRPMDPPRCSYCGSACLDNTCGRLVCMYCRFNDKKHLQHQKWKIKN